MKILYVLFEEVKVPVIKWKGYESSWEDLGKWCRELGISLDHHFETDSVQPDWLTLYTGEKYSAGRGCGFRVVPGMYIVKHRGTSWSKLMCYSPEELKKYFKKCE